MSSCLFIVAKPGLQTIDHRINDMLKIFKAKWRERFSSDHKVQRSGQSTNLLQDCGEYSHWDLHKFNANQELDQSSVDSALLSVIFKDRKESDRIHSERASCWNWYREYLDRKFSTIPKTLLQRNVSDASTVPNFAWFENVLNTTCEMLNQKCHSSLEDISTQLKNSGLVTDNDDEEVGLKQLVFFCIGILTILYEPSVEGHCNELSLANIQDSGVLPSSSTWSTVSIDLAEAGGPIWDILNKFSGSEGPLPCPTTSTGQRDELDTLQASNLNFHHLNRLGGITILLVESMCEHLELDTRAKTLKLFRCPSYCALLSSGQDNGTFLDKSVKLPANPVLLLIFISEFFKVIFAMLTLVLRLIQRKTFWWSF